MKTRLARYFLCVIAIAAVLSCTPNGGYIYSTLETETRVSDSSLLNDLTIANIAKHGADYYAAAGRIYKGTAGAGSVTWDTASPVAPPATGALCNSLVEFAGALYGGFFTPADNLGLYKADATPSFGSSTANPALSGKQVVLLAVVRGGLDLLVATAEQAGAGSNYTYDLWKSTDGVAFVPLITGLAKPITAVAYTSSGPKYWAVSGMSLYAGTATLAAVTAPGDGTDELRSVFSSDETSSLFVTSSQGKVYYSSNEGSTWSESSVTKVNDKNVGFLGITGANPATLLVGSDGYGYYILTVGPPLGLTRFNGNTIGLYGSSVRTLVIDGTRVFACTSGNGLWRGESFDAATGSVGVWSQE